MALLAVLAALLLGLSTALPARVQGRQLLVAERPLHMKGVNWNPVPKGGSHPWGIDYLGFAEGDGKLMKDAGINVLRTYEPLTDVAVLDRLWSMGIQVINTVWANAVDPLSAVTERVEKVKTHPAILMWSVGNEWNYNTCYVKGMSFDDCLNRVSQVVHLVKKLDTAHPVATVYGEVPRNDIMARLSCVDVWGINYYDGLNMASMIVRWSMRSGKPMFLGEYGADAYNAWAGHEDEPAHEIATTVLTQTIVEFSSVHGGACIGGLIFELADEWWKDGRGSKQVHDVGGIAPGGGPHPDKTFNEEWWGLTDIDRKPRRAYHAYQKIATPGTPGLPLVATMNHVAEQLSCTMYGCTPLLASTSSCMPSDDIPVESDAAASALGSNATSSLRR